MNINIEVIPHSTQRYDTCGDWWFEGNDLQIRISDVGDWRYESMIAVHELCEVILCKERGVSQESVDKFDTEYEEKRIWGDDSEPGDEPDAPYQNEHNLATGIERILCASLGIKWSDYEAVIDQLSDFYGVEEIL